MAFSLTLAATPVLAQQASGGEPSASEISLAREQSRIGVEAARQQRWTEAREAFERSYRLYPRPLTLLNLAGAQVESGQLVEGAESYRRFLQQATTGPAAAQREAAQHALLDAEQRIPRLRVAAPHLADSDQLLLDGHAVSHATLGEQLPVDPGPHVIAVLRNGTDIVHMSFTVEPRGTRDVALDVPVAPHPETNNTTANGGNHPVEHNGTTTQIRRPDLATRDDGSLPSSAPPPSRSIATSPILWTVVGVVVLGGAAVGGYFLYNSLAPQPYQGNATPPSVTVR